mgnify:FL=1
MRSGEVLLVLFLGWIFCALPASEAVRKITLASTCGSACQANRDCIGDGTNFCTFCRRGFCAPMCGVGCRNDSDCAGGANPCHLCNENFVCSNAAPRCGDWCNNDAGCLYNGTGPCGGPNRECCFCNSTTSSCGPNQPPHNTCGKPCYSFGDCQGGDSVCTVCKNNVCSQQSGNNCGVTCTSNGQCQAGVCPACVDGTCSKLLPCHAKCQNGAQCSLR